ncbi:uncharacterized protein mgab [Salminus brasiliensis]|uniref:uncharacterized protein mgab n=1 Tax=Salminus brasiliensis TaxID=930266 RepID=UPI003B835983
MDNYGNNQAVVMTKQASHPVALSLVTPAKSPTKNRYTESNITATLENETVWSRFHSLGTEMILTKQGRRMFPCCRFRLSGLDPERKYTLVMDITPLDDFTHKWNGSIWEPAAVGEPHMPGQVCVHPESPALGQQWMEGPVSFYKVKLTNNSTDQEGCVFLRAMQRYQPRLHIIPVDSDSVEAFALDSPNIQMFTFPKTEFYAVTSYQNPQITQLKIDCNPFAMAFRKDSQSVRLLQDKLGISSLGSPLAQLSSLNLASNNSGQNRQQTVLKEAVSSCIKQHSEESLSPESPSPKEGQGILTKTRSYLNGVALCKETVDSKEKDKQPITKPALDKHGTPLAVQPSVNTSIQEPPQTINGPVSSVGTTESSKVISEDAINSPISNAHGKSPAESVMFAPVFLSQGRKKLKLSSVSLAKPPFLSTSQVNRRNTTASFRCKPFRKARKAKSRWWSNVRCTKPAPVFASPDVTLQPDLEDVQGMLFVSFAAKEALDIHVQNMEHVETPLPPLTETQNQSETPDVEEVILSMEERISRLESTLLLHLKQQKHRQVLHPLLQEVGMKLSLLDPKISIDLQYLGVRLPFPPLICDSFNEINSSSITSSLDGAGSFVSRTGKTHDLTKIKGWRDKFNHKTDKVQIMSDGVRNKSAFCSDMLDEYLENEAQQISDRVAVFSKSSSPPVSYQLPSKSSSYVVTLDSLLKARSTPLNKVLCSRENKIQMKPPLRRSPKTSVPFYSKGPHYTTFENKRNRNSTHSFQVDQVISSCGPPPRLGQKNQPSKPPRWSYGITPAKMQMQVMLQDMEEEALSNGKVRTHITTERANFALNSLFTSKYLQKSVRRDQFSMHHHKDACPEEFCRLGCICDSLQREIRGPTHCRRVQCMFDCSCFKHKVLLIHPPKMTTIQQGRRRSLMAFPIADPEKGDRPPPATSITTLWKWKTGEHDPEPLFVPKPALSFKTGPRMRTYVPRLTPQIREEDKDPVYLFFESRMTCARVREYNSNPPPQVHMLPPKKVLQEAEKLSHCFESNVTPTSRNRAGKSNTNVSEISKTPPTAVRPDEPAPTKLLEILSECNWEPHRNLVLSALFGRMSNNLLSEPFCLGMYKIQLLSTTLKKGENCSTITYKVCVSRAAEMKVTNDVQPVVKRIMNSSVSKTRETQTKTGNGTFSAHMASQRKSSPLTDKQPKPTCNKLSKIFSLLTHSLPAGYLKATKKNPGGPAHGLIKVNGKMYNQAKLLLGQMGALNSANRVAAFVTGRLHSRLQDQLKVVADVRKHPVVPIVKPKVANASKPALSTSPRPHPANVPEPNTVPRRTRKSKLTTLNALSKHVEESTSQKKDSSIIPPSAPPATTPIVSASSTSFHAPFQPSSAASTPSAKTAIPTALPPGQQVVLQNLPGVSGSNFLCQYNGQIIQLMPIGSGLVGQPQACLKEGSSPQPKDCSVQKPVSFASSTKPSSKMFPIIAPKILSLSGSSGMNIASGTPAFNLQSSFPGKTGTFSFRICPPSAGNKSVGSQQGAKLPDAFVAAPSALVLPGGFTLIKLPLESHPGVPAVPVDVPSSLSDPAELPQKDKCIGKAVTQNCSPSTEPTCQVSESSSKPAISETSNSDTTPADAASLSHGNSALTAKSVEDQQVENKANNKAGCDKGDWVPEASKMILKREHDEHEQRCQVSESCSKPAISETLNSGSTQADAAGLSHGNSALMSKDVKDELVEKTFDSVHANNEADCDKGDWVPGGAEIIIKSEQDEHEQGCQVSESSSDPSVSGTSNSGSAWADAAGLSHGNHALTSRDVEDELVEKNLDTLDTSNKTAYGKYDWIPEGAEMILKSEHDEDESEQGDLDDWPPKGAERVLWMEEDSTDEEEKEDFSEQPSINADTSVRSPADLKAKNSNTTTADLLSVDEEDISKSLHNHENGLSPEADKHLKMSPSSAEQRRMASPLPAKDNEIVYDKTHEINLIHINNKNEQGSCVDGSTALLKQPNNKDKEGSLVLIQTEPTKEPVQKDMDGNQPNISEQGLAPENSSPVVSKRGAANTGKQAHVVSNLVDGREQSLGLVSSCDVINKLERYSDPQQMDTSSDHSVSEQDTTTRNTLPITDEQATNRNATTTSITHPHLSKQNLNSEDLEEQSKDLGQTESQISTSANNTSDVKDAKDDDYIDIDGDVPCPLLEGQTPATFTLPVAPLPNATSENAELKSSRHSLRFLKNPSCEKNEVQCKSGKQLDDNVRKFRRAKHVKRDDDDVTGEQKHKKRNMWLQLKKADHEPCVEEDIDRVTSSDGDPDSDSNEGSSDSNDKDLSSDDEENSINYSESTSDSEATEESANSPSREDDTVDIESFEENQERRIIGKMKDGVTQYRKAKGADQFIKRLQRTDTSNRMDHLLTNEEARRLTHTEKERLRRGEMRQSFVSLKAALNIEEQIKMCKHDILIQARLMIRALEDRNQTLEERKKALLQKQSSYISTIAELSGKTKEMVKLNLKENCAHSVDIHNLVPASVKSPQINPQRLDADGNQLPPRLGLWRSNNYIRKRPEKSPQQPSVTPTERRTKMVKEIWKDGCEKEMPFDVQDLMPTASSSPQINPRRIDSEGNQLPPRLGLWKSNNYIRKRSKKSTGRKSSVTTTEAVNESSDTCLSSQVSPGSRLNGPLPSVKPGDMVMKLIAQNPSILPSIPNRKTLSEDLRPSETGLLTLPKIVLQSFGNTDTEKLEKTSLPSSPQSSKSTEHSLDITLDLPDNEAGMEEGDSSKNCKGLEKSSMSEESNEENPVSSSLVSESFIENKTLPQLEQDKPTTTGLVNVGKRKSKHHVVIEDALSHPDASGPRVLRNRSPAANTMSTRSMSREKGKRLFR